MWSITVDKKTAIKQQIHWCDKSHNIYWIGIDRTVQITFRWFIPNKEERLGRCWGPFIVFFFSEPIPIINYQGNRFTIDLQFIFGKCTKSLLTTYIIWSNLKAFYECCVKVNWWQPSFQEVCAKVSVLCIWQSALSFLPTWHVHNFPLIAECRCCFILVFLTKTENHICLDLLHIFLFSINPVTLQMGHKGITK